MTKKKREKEPLLTHAVSVPSIVLRCPTRLHVLCPGGLRGLFCTFTVTQQESPSVIVRDFSDSWETQARVTFPELSPWNHTVTMGSCFCVLNVFS